MDWSFKVINLVWLMTLQMQMEGLQCWSESNSGIVQVIEGTTTQLSCVDIIEQQDSIDDGDTLQVILFYRGEELRKPVFTYDARRVVARQWTSPDYNGAALRFLVDSFQLEITNVSSLDQGWWHCRVEFEMSSFRVQSTQVVVVERPSEPVIVNQHGQILHRIDGVFDEDGAIQLYCQARLSTPVSSLTWFVDGQLWAGDNAPSLVRAGHVKKMLQMERVARHYSGKSLTCQSSNSRLTSPKNVSLTLRLNLRPQKMEIRDDYHLVAKETLALTTSKMERVLCRVYGSRPPANVSWWKGNTKLPTVERFGLDDGIEYVEIAYEWQPSLEEDGHLLRCRAVHSKFPDLKMQRDIVLNVYHAPVVDIQLSDGTRNSATSQEDEQLLLRCSVRSSKPGVQSYLWYYNNEAIGGNDAGVTMEGDSLILHRLGRFQSGRYACVARNSQGLGHKSFISIQVSHVPVCQWDKMASKMYVSNKADNVMAASCYVDAKPAVDNFWWTYYSVNRTPEAVNIPKAWHSELEGHSQLKIASLNAPWRGHSSADSEGSMGWLLCWAQNSAGIIREPCKIALHPAGIPQRPHSCTATQLQGTLISCSPGLDGGSPTSFIMELWHPAERNPFGTWTNSKAEFSLPPMILDGGAIYSALPAEQQVIEARIFAINSHGRSGAATLCLAKQKSSSNRLSVDSGRYVSWYPSTVFSWLGGIVAAAVSVSAAVIVVCILFRRRRRRASAARLRPGTSPKRDSKIIADKSAMVFDADYFIANRRWSESSM